MVIDILQLIIDRLTAKGTPEALARAAQIKQDRARRRSQSEINNTADTTPAGAGNSQKKAHAATARPIPSLGSNPVDQPTHWSGPTAP